MIEIKNNNTEVYCDILKLKYINIEKQNNEFKVSLIDNQGYKIVCGYGISVELALDDMLHNLT